jgi:hypothetical protein
MPHAAEEVLFDGELHPSTPLHELWQIGDSFSPLSTKAKFKRAEHGSLLLREIVEADMYGAHELGYEAALETTQRHLTRLRQLGMSVVSHAFELNDEPVVADDDEVIIGYAATTYVTHCYPINQPRALRLANDQKIARFVTQPLERYLDWCKETKEPYFLADIIDPWQYGVHGTSRTVFLFDIDPFLLPRTRDTFADTRWRLRTNFLDQ